MKTVKRFLTTGLILLALQGLNPQALCADNKILGLPGGIYDLPADEADAMEFLYRSMALPDRAMYTPEFYLRNVRTSLRAKEEMPWAKQIPEHIWRHFVLPVRANNENLDDFRSHYYDELAERVKGKSMYDAALEVNHWLHEKVTYQPSDARTSSPEATIRTAKGRCGEESVLGVAAFRTVGIPARQVYTPRWAHTDDNHAWVEVWVDGKWYFLGACEPEPELNRAWFNAPASRGMLMHTRVFGNYPGPEQIMSVNGGITEINVTDNYVPVRDAEVKVTLPGNKVASDIQVDYKIYNYAEFFTAARRNTNNQGIATLKTGLGDMLAWAADGNNFGFAKVAADFTHLELSHKIGECFSVDIEIVPPKENPIPSTATSEQIAENQRRFEAENRMRQLYEDTFFGEKYCSMNEQVIFTTFGQQRGYKINNLLKKAKGNWEDIYYFISYVDPSRLDEAIAMLEAISEKDLRDTPSQVLSATLQATPAQPANPLYIEYILNPRIANEKLSDYRAAMRPAGKTDNLSAMQIFEYVKTRIKVDDQSNAYKVPLTPVAVWKEGRADRHSRDIFFVAACRNNGIAARIDPVSGDCQYAEDGKWISVNFDSGKTQVRDTGTLRAAYTPSKYLVDPEYYRHFTISEIVDGRPRLIDFGDDLGETYSSLLADGLSLPAGYYMLTTGVRQANGSVNAHMTFFNIEKDRTTDLDLFINHNPQALEVIGSIDAEKLYAKPSGEKSSVLSTTGRGYFILGILGDTDEPSNHAVTELASVATMLNSWDRPVLLLSRERKELSELKNLHYGQDINSTIEKMLRSSVNTESAADERLPVIVLADSFGRVVFFTSGYDTSLGQKLNDVISRLE